MDNTIRHLLISSYLSEEHSQERYKWSSIIEILLHLGSICLTVVFFRHELTELVKLSEQKCLVIDE